ncbi:radical SAM protein [Streptomyces sp. NPDC003077]|uniref:radical SAM protein n=1 Tax=Streptomyces sp. NPDC003077 TaxID=3154443 RepID=UPI0033A9BCEB
MTAVVESPQRPPVGMLQSLELEITEGCQLRCVHCLADSGPQGTHGTMETADWLQVISDAARLEIPRVQLIGGEPTLHPAWRQMVDTALDLGRTVEVYSNLYRVHDAWWQVFRRKGVSLATSYYSDRAEEHDAITTRIGSYHRTRANIEKAVRLGVPLRAGIVHTHEGQRTAEARDELAALGVRHVTTDRVRAVGRAAGRMPPGVSELCGRCGRERAAVLPNGDLVLCVLARFMPVGNVHTRRLPDLIGSEPWRAAIGFVPSREAGGCDPNDQSCQPGQPACLPKFPHTPQGGAR